MSTHKQIRTEVTPIVHHYGCVRYWQSVTAHVVPIDDYAQGIRYAATVRSIDACDFDLSIVVDNDGCVIVGDDRHTFAIGTWWDAKADGSVEMETDDMPDEGAWIGSFFDDLDGDHTCSDLRQHAHDVLYYGVRRALSACAALDPLYQRWMAIAAGEDPDEYNGAPSPDFPEWDDDPDDNGGQS
jgi:hypothetical protein